jgi:Xaa-Pro aminopeptidase
MAGYDAVLIISSSEIDANMFYASRFLAPDPFVYLEVKKKKILMMSDLEIERAKLQSTVDEVLPSASYNKAAKKKGIEQPGLVDEVHELLSELAVKSLLVPANFPVFYADSLRAKGYQIESKQEPFFEERLVKTEEEIALISKALRHTEEVFAMVVEEIKKARIKDSLLYKNDKPLLSEDIKELISSELIRHQCIAQHTIVACGDDACNPHSEGEGVLKADESIVIDIFPRSIETGYFADFSRTVVKGKASKKLEKMYHAVEKAQGKALELIREGVFTDEVHSAVQEVFHQAGFKTGLIDGKTQGFIHGTGHGVGLDIHELPRIGRLRDTLKEGNVVTVEPGLYYYGLGGVRLEDLVVVRKNGCENLTISPKVLVI